MQGNADFPCPHCDISSISGGESGVESQKPESPKPDVDQQWRQAAGGKIGGKTGNRIFGAKQSALALHYSHNVAGLSASEPELTTHSLVSLLYDADITRPKLEDDTSPCLTYHLLNGFVYRAQICLKKNLNV